MKVRRTQHNPALHITHGHLLGFQRWLIQPLYSKGRTTQEEVKAKRWRARGVTRESNVNENCFSVTIVEQSIGVTAPLAQPRMKATKLPVFVEDRLGCSWCVQRALAARVGKELQQARNGHSGRGAAPHDGAIGRWHVTWRPCSPMYPHMWAVHGGGPQAPLGPTRKTSPMPVMVCRVFMERAIPQ